MRRLLRTLLLAVFLAAAGWGTSELLFRWPVTRPLLVRLLGQDFATPAEVALQEASAGEQVPEDSIERELDLLRHQFADEKAFEGALIEAGSTREKFRRELTEHLRTLQWLEKKISPEINVTEAECREFYNAAADNFVQPVRFRVSHLFLAAHEGSAPEIVSEKRAAIQGCAIRILGGEGFRAVLGEVSEDEATKARGGDLGYFSVARMPPEFIAEVEKLRVGELSAPIQTPLGFHVLQLTERKESKQMRFDEAKGEIANMLRNRKRVAAVAQPSELVVRD